MTTPYQNCPILQNARWCLRLVDVSDAEALLKVYSDEKAVPIFNSDNCLDDFHYPSLQRMQEAIRFWLESYAREDFVRWTIFDRTSGEAIGTAELFHRVSKDYYKDCGLLRLDLRSDYETESHVANLLELIVPPAYEWFSCSRVATKIPPFAEERRKAAAVCGFVPGPEKLIGHAGCAYGDYYVRLKEGAEP